MWSCCFRFIPVFRMGLCRNLRNGQRDIDVVGIVVAVTVTVLITGLSASLLLVALLRITLLRITLLRITLLRITLLRITLLRE